MLGNFFGGSTSVGINTLWNLDYDNGDNGVYIIEGWKVVDRYYHEGAEQQEYDLKEMLVAIDERMPAQEQLGKELLTGTPVPVGTLKVGDMVYFKDWDGSYSIETVIGIGCDTTINGHDVLGVPYINRWGNDYPETNINNYLLEDAYVLHRPDPEQKAE